LVGSPRSICRHIITPHQEEKSHELVMLLPLSTMDGPPTTTTTTFYLTNLHTMEKLGTDNILFHLIQDKKKVFHRLIGLNPLREIHQQLEENLPPIVILWLYLMPGYLEGSIGRHILVFPLFES